VTVTKRLIDIDDDSLNGAMAALDCATMKQTVNEALNLAIRIRAGLDHIDTLASGELSDIADAEVMAGAWR